MSPLEPFETHKWSSEMGDFVGIESCIDLQKDDTSSKEKGVRHRRQRREKEEFPPPLPPRGPLRRYHTCDGRLVIESGSLPEILRSHRENNRLTIDLISLENHFQTDGDDNMGEDQTVEEEPVRIYKYDFGVRSNPCMVGIAVPAIRHVTI